jgi:hypothetical protein
MPRGPRLEAPPQSRGKSPGIFSAKRTSPPKADKPVPAASGRAHRMGAVAISGLGRSVRRVGRALG